MSAELPSSLVLLGAGKMGQAMLSGWLRHGLEPSRITAIDPHLDQGGRALLFREGVPHVATPDGLASPEALVLAIKPQTLESAAPGVRSLIGKDTLVLSILAGKRIADISSRLGTLAGVVRAMPNTPAAVARGISAAVVAPGTTARQRAMANALLASIGRVEWIDDEALIDPVTAVSGSGPAYVFLLVEALADAGTKAGLPPDLAMRLARATIEGAGELLFRDAKTEASMLRRNVTSPGGTTAAALDVLMGNDELSALMERAVAAASRRARELAG